MQMSQYAAQTRQRCCRRLDTGSICSPLHLQQMLNQDHRSKATRHKASEQLSLLQGGPFEDKTRKEAVADEGGVQELALQWELPTRNHSRLSQLFNHFNADDTGEEPADVF